MSFPEYLNEHIKNKEDLVKISDTIYGFASKIEAQKIDKKKKNKTLLLITGLPGAGKDSVAQLLIERDKRFGWIKTCTTRPKRPEEMISDPYIHLTEEEFQIAQEGDDVIESAPYAEHQYCSLKSVVYRAFEKNDISILRIDPKGTETYYKKWKNGESVFDNINLICVFIAPPSVEELKERLLKRSNDPSFVEKRLIQMDLDLRLINETEYIVLNETGKLKEAVDGIVSLVS